MKRIYIAAFALAVVLPSAAQDTYESARLLGSDLNGTARYVGMGGAMEALGADISTISTNPAGIGLFRHSTISASGSMLVLQGVQKFNDQGTTKMSFDQFGFVYSSRVSRRSFVNVGFNYHKSRNFNQIISAVNSLRNASQNHLTYMKHRDRSSNNGGFWLDYNQNDEVIGWRDKTSDVRSQTFSQSDYINANAFMCDRELYNELYDKTYDNPDMEDDWVFYNEADRYMFDRAQRGWINEYDFCVSGNQNDRFYWGVTVGIYDVNYKGFSIYTERLVNINDDPTGYDGNEDYIDYLDEHYIEGTGISVKAGVIFRPIEDSPFRIGLSASTPTWYELTTDNNTDFNNDSEYGYEDYWYSGEGYKFRYYTPWKFGASLGHTIGNNIALGLSYEVSDYSSAVNRIFDDPNIYGNERTYIDRPMEQNTEKSLKTVHLLKAGIEYKPSPALAFRFGYNYESSAYDKNGVRDMTLDSPGVAYSSTTDYVNWKDTHRVTCGVGYKVDGWNFDLAYQYNTMSGDFYPMQKFEADQNVGMTNVKFNRHQMLLTIGYSF